MEAKAKWKENDEVGGARLGRFVILARALIPANSRRSTKAMDRTIYLIRSTSVRSSNL